MANRRVTTVILGTSTLISDSDTAVVGNGIATSSGSLTVTAASGAISVAANNSVALATGTGAIDGSLGTGVTKTTTGASSFLGSSNTFSADLNFSVVGNNTYRVRPLQATVGLIGDSVRVQGATGFDSNGTSASTLGGSGRSVGGTGGAASGALAASNGGAGQVNGGTGGAGGAGAGAAGIGGGGNCVGGVGGAGSATVAPGAGGRAALIGGASGAVGGFGGSAIGGDVVIRGGVGTVTNGPIQIADTNTSGIGFWNATPVAQPTITGSRGGNAALASLLTQLAAYGLIIDGTSA